MPRLLDILNPFSSSTNPCVNTVVRRLPFRGDAGE